MNPVLGRRQLMLGGIAGTAAVGLGLSACSDGAGSGGEGGEVTHMQFFLSGDANQGGGYAHMAAKYQEETGIEVEIVDVANEDLTTKLKNAALANDLPALARVGSIDATWKDVTMDLRDILDTNDVKSELAAIDPDGKVLSLPSDITAVGMFLNKTLFDAAGATYPAVGEEPWTWDEFTETIRSVQAATGASYGMVMDRSAHRLKAFLYEFGSNTFELVDGAFETNENTKPALEYFYGLNDDSFMPRSVWLSDGDPNGLFKSGDVVAYCSGSWQIADFAVNIADFEWVSVYMPKQPVRVTNYGNAASIVVFEGTGQEQAALDFVNWLYTPENYTELSETSGFLPAVNGITVTYADNAEAFELYNEEIEASDEVAARLKTQDLEGEIEGRTIEGDPLRDETVKYLNDEQDVDTTIANIIELLNASL
ncbi:ABC transporter substrate-binding protein [Occultella gossypii]|uniref:Extracellular solute-binding protein n=1 Tax=Occultella gossypii TaxID=2800820 RepID=A0ABS7S4T6_9MICO|nr:extracellular solute-binding protein [Occultella gossypii]MBZ2194923.1 extracellular solute-binding protein [Occultella gossypii]